MNHTIWKRMLSLLLILVMVFSMCLSAQAASSASKSVVVPSGSKARQQTNTFAISGNLLSQKKITIGGKTLPAICGSTASNALSQLTNLSRFNVVVYDSKGAKVASYSNLKIGSSFKLPMWSWQTYKITITSSFASFKSSNMAQFNAAYFGTYFLKY